MKNLLKEDKKIRKHYGNNFFKKSKKMEKDKIDHLILKSEGCEIHRKRKGRIPLTHNPSKTYYGAMKP